ncbi:MAG: hypothetical protein HUU26_07305 [Gemmatimonadaceae bacterium]|nr:hypothetical protein [Gemmatimonadaceae bacterium]
MREFRSPDGLTWQVAVKLPSHSSAMVLFLHPDGRSSSGDRYAWINAPARMTTDPRERLMAQALLDAVDDRQLAALFRRSMPVSRPPSVTRVS